MRMQYVEIYNETIKDLIAPANGPLDVREDPRKGTFVAVSPALHPPSHLPTITTVTRTNARARTPWVALPVKLSQNGLRASPLPAAAARCRMALPPRAPPP